MNITIPEIALVVLIGPSGSGKSTFARRHFQSPEILSSDVCRGLVSNDENDQAATPDAFDVLHFIAGKRLARALLTVVDATNVQSEARQPLVALARQYHALPVAIVLDTPRHICEQRNRTRPDRNFGPHVIPSQCKQLRQSLRREGLQREGFRHVFILDENTPLDAVTITREPLWNNRKHEHGPFDIIGDVHGCADELEQLLVQLGYDRSASSESTAPACAHPQGRKAVFLGDLVDRGPRILDTLNIVMAMVEQGSALCIPGNHDIKLLKKLNGKQVQITHGLQQTIAEFEALPATERDALTPRVKTFLDGLISHYVLDNGELVVAHAGLKESMQGRGSRAVREFCLYGETTGESDEFGLPVRYNWAADYRGRAMVVYGHTPVPDAQWFNRTINIDTGCVFGGKLTALRYPERELVCVPARLTYCIPARPFLAANDAAPALSMQQAHDDVLDLADVLGKRQITTRLMHDVTIREANAVAALEVMSRFAVDPRWLIYLPPTMSPCETSMLPEYLEHPAEALAHFRHEGVPHVLCEEKHMGSRAVLIVCRDAAAAHQRFGVTDDSAAQGGIIYTRTGRRFFDDAQMESQVLQMVRAALDQTNFWDTWKTSWACLDVEIMPWSAKAQALLKEQYAAVGVSASAALHAAQAALATTAATGLDVSALSARYQFRAQAVTQYIDAYRRYCWPVSSVQDLRIAPFHLLATESGVHVDQDHVWHMQTLASLAATDAGRTLLMPTVHRLVDLSDQASIDAAITWWLDLTSRGGEGMVVKPLSFIARGSRGLLQPAVKCRGREYLRIIYGPEYTAPEHLTRLRARHLHGKRMLALREFALGIEGLERFVRHEPLRRVHECVFGVLALESEPVDPRL